MTRLRSSVARRSLAGAAALGGFLALLACGSSQGSEPPRSTPAPEAGDVPSDAPPEADGGDRGDAAEPPPYDFAVSCAGEPCVTQIAARGGAHACALLEDGSVWCWGSNVSGQLGTGGNAGSIPPFAAAPRAVAGVSAVKGISATGDGVTGTTCVVSGDGAVACFGSDLWGQLGRGAGGSLDANPAPVVVEGLNAKSVTLADTFALAVSADGRLWSWGTNDTLQLARAAWDAGSISKAAPADLVSTPVRSCAGTARTGFVVADDGSLSSWGGGLSEQIGRVISVPRDPVPSAVDLAQVSAVATGAAHACALGRGRVHCWGDNEHGQLGTGRKAGEWFPAPVALPSGVYPVALAAGGNNTCILAADGGVHCWGANGAGQVGAPAGPDRPVPTRIDGLGEPTVSVAIMDETVCALLRSGSVACWGDNRAGQLGRGDRDADRHPAPSPVVFE